jgi:putative acetyltransferase
MILLQIVAESNIRNRENNNLFFFVTRTEFSIQRAEISDMAEMQRLFVNTVKNVCSKDHDPEQIRVWSRSVNNTQRWMDLLQNQFVLLCVKDKKIIGFASLENNNYLDFLYVHESFQRQGIGKMLLHFILAEAIKKGAHEIASDVSKTAEIFFESMGFEFVKENHFEMDGVNITNYKMIKALIRN